MDKLIKERACPVSKNKEFFSVKYFSDPPTGKVCS